MMNPSAAMIPKPMVAHRTGRHRGEGGRPSGNSSRTSGTASRATTKIQLWSQASGTTIVGEPVTSPRVTNSSENAVMAKVAAIAQKSHPIAFRGCRDAMRAPTPPYPSTRPIPP